MYTFGKSSTEKLLTCRNELQVVAHEAIKLVDFSIIHGYRTQEQQDLIYAQGLSKAPIRAYVLIIIIWPYQLYLQWKYEND